MRSIWVFLACGRFATKTTARTCWISLDFLGFSRPNRDFSMGYTDFCAKDFSSRFVCGVGSTRSAGVAFGMRKGRSTHRAKLTLISDFLQLNVVRPFLLRPSQSKPTRAKVNTNQLRRLRPESGRSLQPIQRRESTSSGQSFRTREVIFAGVGFQGCGTQQACRGVRCFE